MNGCAAHEDAWREAAIAHCDVSLGNIQINKGRGILADWEFGTPVSQLSTDRAINSVSLTHRSTGLHIDFEQRERSIRCHRDLLTISLNLSPCQRFHCTGRYGMKCARYIYASSLPCWKRLRFETHRECLPTCCYTWATPSCCCLSIDQIPLSLLPSR